MNDDNINANYFALFNFMLFTGLIRKLKYSDVITTNSVNLPPYKISNKLGVTITLGLYMGEDVIKTITLKPNQLVPIDMDTLEELRRKKVTRRTSHRSSSLLKDTVSMVGSFHNHAEEEHRLGLSLELRNPLGTSYR